MPNYRGRLIWPFVADIARLDTAGTVAEPGAGNVVTGYDPDFREPVVYAAGDSPRAEIEVLGLPCQVHPDKGDFNNLQMMLSGAVKAYSLHLCFHYIDLEARNLVDTDGSALIKNNDRLIRIRHLITGQIVSDFTNRPVYVTQPQDRGMGMSALSRNLLMVRFEERETSILSV